MRFDELSSGALWEELPQLSAPRRFLIVLGAWFVLGVAGFFLFWRADLDRSLQLETDIQQTLVKLDGQSRLLLEKPRIEAELASLEAQLPVLKQALPSDRELASLLDRINEMILDQNLRLSEFTPLTPLNKEVMRVVPVKVSVRGEGASIARLPNYIASLSRQVSLREFEMTVEPNTGSWQLKGELHAYAQLPATMPTVPEAEEQGEVENPETEEVLPQ